MGRSKSSSTRREFFLVLVDEDRRIFNIVGPIADDDAWSAKIVELQNSGRKVRCFATGVERSVEQIALLYSNQTGFTYSINLIAEPSQLSTTDIRDRCQPTRVVPTGIV